MKQFLFLLFFLPEVVLSQTIFDDFDSFIKSHNVFGSVDYSLIEKYPSDVNDIVDKIARYDLTEASEQHKTAFYINAYNILVIYQVTLHYPINSPLDVEGFFKSKRFEVAGELLTLDQIEFQKLTDVTNDPRIHFCLACAAKGCPYLDESAYLPSNLENQLYRRTSLIIEQPDYVFIDHNTEEVILCQIFNWYKDQFSANSGSAVEFINQFRRERIPTTYSVKYREYDWSLNDR